MIEYVNFDNKLYAVIIRSSFNEKGVHFISEPTEPLQLGVQVHPEGHKILPHIHKNNVRNIIITQEIIHIEYGEIEAEFYLNEIIVGKRHLFEGDTIILIQGGHGFNVLKNTKLIEVKQGPYLSQAEDKKFINEVKQGVLY